MKKGKISRLSSSDPGYAAHRREQFRRAARVARERAVVERKLLVEDNAALRAELEQLATKSSSLEAELSESLCLMRLAEENELLKKLVLEHSLFVAVTVGLTRSVDAQDVFVSRDLAVQELESCRLCCLWMLSSSSKDFSPPSQDLWGDAAVASCSFSYRSDGALLLRSDVKIKRPESSSHPFMFSARQMAQYMALAVTSPATLERFQSNAGKQVNIDLVSQASWVDENRRVVTLCSNEAALNTINVIALGKEAQTRSLLGTSGQAGVVECVTMFRTSSVLEKIQSEGAGCACEFSYREGWFIWDDDDGVRISILHCMPNNGTHSGFQAIEHMPVPGKSLSAQFMSALKVQVLATRF